MEQCGPTGDGWTGWPPNEKPWPIKHRAEVMYAPRQSALAVAWTNTHAASTLKHQLRLGRSRGALAASGAVGANR